MVGKNEKKKRKEARDRQRSKEKLEKTNFGPIKLAMMSELGEFFAKSGLCGLTPDEVDMATITPMAFKLQPQIQSFSQRLQTPKGEVDFEDLFAFLCDKFALFSHFGIHGMAPSHDLCEMLKNTEITIDADHFKLPYRAFVIKLPDNALNFNYVILNMSHTEEQLQFFFASQGFFDVIRGTSSQQATYLTQFFPLADNLKMRDLFNAIGSIIHEDKDYKLESLFSTRYLKAQLSFDEGHEIFEDLVVDLIRISINCVLYLTSRKPDETVVRTEAPTKNRPILRPDIEMKEYGFTQQIKIKTVNKEYGPGEGKGSPKSPHWRRGYWRNQHHGEGNKLTKLIFIPPTFINPTHFKGDKADTGANYE